MSATRKYDFTGETRDGLRRIRALVRLPGVEIGDPGGWIEREENLSHDGAAWVYDAAQVSGAARVYGAAQVYGDAQVSGAARVYGDARVYGAADLIVIGPIGSRSDYLTVAPDAKLEWAVSTGCFHGSLKQFRAALAKRHRTGRFRREYDAALAFIGAVLRARATKAKVATREKAGS